MGHLLYRGIIMYATHSASTVSEQDGQLETKHLLLSSSTVQKLPSAPNTETSKSTLGVTHRGTPSLFYWTRAGAVLGAMWGLVFDTVVLPIPGISPDLFAGPLASWIAAVIQDAIMFGCISAACTGLLRIAMRKGSPIN
jgi:hypothetical protein